MPWTGRHFKLPKWVKLCRDAAQFLIAIQQHRAYPHAVVCLLAVRTASADDSLILERNVQSHFKWHKPPTKQNCPAGVLSNCQGIVERGGVCVEKQKHTKHCLGKKDSFNLVGVQFCPFEVRYEDNLIWILIDAGVLTTVVAKCLSIFACLSDLADVSKKACS